MTEKETQWITSTFNVTTDETIGHRSGICYSKLWVKTEEAAKRASATMKGQTVNGGWFDGMPLGAITPPANGESSWEVMV